MWNAESSLAAYDDAAYPTPVETYSVLEAVARQLGTDVCWLYEGAFHFRLDDTWTLAIRPESAGRFQIAACERTAPRATVWTLGEGERLAVLVEEARAAVQAAGDTVEVQS